MSPSVFGNLIRSSNPSKVSSSLRFSRGSQAKPAILVAYSEADERLICYIGVSISCGFHLRMHVKYIHLHSKIPLYLG